MMQDYSTIPALADVVLEASWTLGIVARPGEVVFDMDLVMTTDHPDYRPADPGEQWATIRGSLTFVGVTTLTWTNQGALPSRDLSGTYDYDNIDSFRNDGDDYELEGSWGEMRLTAKSVRIDYPPKD